MFLNLKTKIQSALSFNFLISNELGYYIFGGFSISGSCKVRFGLKVVRFCQVALDKYLKRSLKPYQNSIKALKTYL